MALNNSSADACADAICTALNITDTPSKDKMKAQWRVIYAKLKADITIQIAAGSIVTTGSAATQTGPATPIPLNPL
jgi:hypothetical protein